MLHLRSWLARAGKIHYNKGEFIIEFIAYDGKGVYLAMNAKKIIFQAFYDLLQKQSISAISVSMIIEAAEVSKPTFYRYYYNKFDLLNRIFEEILSPMYEAGFSLDWTQALEKTFASLEDNRTVFRNGFKTEDQYNLRNDIMFRIIENAINRMLEHGGVDIQQQPCAFAIRSCAITHVAAMCGWVLDSKRQPAEQTIALLLGTLPYQLYPYFTQMTIREKN